MTDHGTFETVDDRPALRFERRLRHPVERVWRAITEPADLAQWFPDTIEADWRAGAVRFLDHVQGGSTGEVLEHDPPRRLAYTWYTNELRFELEPDGDGATLLRLTALLGEREAAARDAAGWHVCLDRLEQALATGDAEAPDSRPTPEWSALFDAYVAAGVPEGAPIPGRD
ncbi:MAG: hypothetical protein QOE86_408 [Solirubrobacteraceae bacterium]|jgi:uncharacterized protein YndB with AHSA1/START domain|nr:hypothetical protein [Solirubrobacteraceae bacterium]